MGIIKSFLQKFLLLGLLVSGMSVLAQPTIKKSSRIEVIGGKKFYMHKVEKGETLYSIGKTYDVTGNEIVVENPEVIDGLKPGQTIRVPVKEEVKKDPFFFKGPFHVVKKGDTVYSLTKLYNTTLEELVKLNPELKDNALKLGQILKLPANTPNGQVATPVKNDSVTVVTKPVVKDTVDLRVAFLLPFFTAMNEDEKEYKNVNDQAVICPKSQIGVSFYEGAMIAIDSLRRQGFHATIHTYDSENDSARIENIIRKPEMKEMDLIIGPLYTSNFKRVSDFAKKNHIPLVSPFSQVNKILLGNPYIYKATASIITQVEELARFVSEKGSGKTIVLLNSDNAREKALYDVFKNRYKSFQSNDSLVELSFKKAGTGAIDQLLSKGKQVWLVALSNDQVFVTDLVNKLYGMKSDNLRLFGLESWTGFESLEPEYLMKLHVSLTVPQYLDLESDTARQFIVSYRSKYKTDPDKFALHGFDVTYYFLQRLKEQGRNFAEGDLAEKQGLQTGFNFVRTAVESGFENKFTNILEYKDYRLEKIN